MTVQVQEWEWCLNLAISNQTSVNQREKTQFSVHCVFQFWMYQDEVFDHKTDRNIPSLVSFVIVLHSLKMAPSNFWSFRLVSSIPCTYEQCYRRYSNMYCIKSYDAVVVYVSSYTNGMQYSLILHIVKADIACRQG